MSVIDILLNMNHIIQEIEIGRVVLGAHEGAMDMVDMMVLVDHTSTWLFLGILAAPCLRPQATD